MFFKAAILLALASAAVVPRGTAVGESDSPESAWLVYQDSEAGLEVSYPADWEVIVAERRLDSSAAWSPLVLGDGELSKVAFRERGEAPWPGWYEVRVLANPDSLTLDDYWADFDLSDLWDRSAADSVLAGRPSKTLVRWRHDSLTREHLLVYVRGAIHILHDEHNSNDPDFEDHQRVYTKMTPTLRVQSVEEPEEGAKAASPK